MEFLSYEEVIASGWNTFVQVGLALAKIRDGLLYREQYGTFEDYCRQRWNYGRSYAYRLISGAQVFTHLLTTCQQKPQHESKVRPLVGPALTSRPAKK
jgi:hypothetical protein